MLLSTLKRRLCETIKEYHRRREHVDQRRFTDKQIMFGLEDQNEYTGHRDVNILEMVENPNKQ
jgi:hypothetical protein